MSEARRRETIFDRHPALRVLVGVGILLLIAGAALRELLSESSTPLRAANGEPILQFDKPLRKLLSSVDDWLPPFLSTSLPFPEDPTAEGHLGGDHDAGHDAGQEQEAAPAPRRVNVFQDDPTGLLR